MHMNLNNIKNIILKAKNCILSNRQRTFYCVVSAALAIIALFSVISIIRIRHRSAIQLMDVSKTQELFTVSKSAELTAKDLSLNDISSSDDVKLPLVTDETTNEPDAWYLSIDVDLEALSEQNTDIVGWIYFENEESISYPLLFSGDDHYLRRNYLGEKDVAGSIYIDGHNDPSLSDAHTLIYGHNMRNLSMFGNLKLYRNEEGYYEGHRYFQLITKEAAYRYEIFSYKEVEVLTGGIYTIWHYVDDDFKEFVKNEIIAGSYIDAELNVENDTHIVTLSTCTYENPDNRFTVSAVRVDEHKWK